MYSVKNLIQLCVSLTFVCLPSIVQGVSLFSGPMVEKKLAHRALIPANEVLHRHMEYQKLEILALKTYTPRVEFQGELCANLSNALYGNLHTPVEGYGDVILFFGDWLTAYLSVDSTRPQNTAFNSSNLDNAQLILGNFLHFPCYVQFGLYNLPLGAHESDFFSPEWLLTRKTLYPYSFIGGAIGGNYLPNSHHSLQSNVFFFNGAQNQHNNEWFNLDMVGLAFQYGMHFNPADIIVGGSGYRSLSKRTDNGRNIYLNCTLGNVKTYYEYMQANRGYAYHLEVAYYRTFYRHPGALVVGGEQGRTKHIGSRVGSRGSVMEVEHCYGFGGARIEFMQHLTLVVGAKWDFAGYIHAADFNEIPNSNSSSAWYNYLSPICHVKFTVY